MGSVGHRRRRWLKTPASPLVRFVVRSHLYASWASSHVKSSVAPTALAEATTSLSKSAPSPSGRTCRLSAGNRQVAPSKRHVVPNQRHVVPDMNRHRIIRGTVISQRASESARRKLCSSGRSRSRSSPGSASLRPRKVFGWLRRFNLCATFASCWRPRGCRSSRR